MSAFNAKNLSYTKQEPSFLRKLREQNGGDRHNVQFARPKNDRLKMGDRDEDEPTVVDENGETLGQQEWEEMSKKEKDGQGEKDGDAAARNDQEDGVGIDRRDGERKADGKERRQVAEIGTGKKRKAGKVVGSEVEPDGASPKDEHAKKADQKQQLPSTKKRLKKIKLSFDEPSED